MQRKTISTVLLISAFLTVISFLAGIIYERRRNSDETLDLDHALVLLLARPADFEIIGDQWSSIDYSQIYYEPTQKGMSLEYEIARKHFTIGFPEIHATFNVTHEIKRYRPDELPKKTWIDDIYIEKEASSEMEVHLLNLEELDKNTMAFCVLSKETTSITCYVESKYKEIISIFTFYGYNMEEMQIISFIKPALRKFYYRLSSSSIK